MIALFPRNYASCESHEETVHWRKRLFIPSCATVYL